MNDNNIMLTKVKHLLYFNPESAAELDVTNTKKIMPTKMLLLVN